MNTNSNIIHLSYSIANVWLLPFLTSSVWFSGLGLFWKCFISTWYMQTTFVLNIYLHLAYLKPGWPVGKSNFNENPAISLDLGLELRLKVCQQIMSAGCAPLKILYNQALKWTKVWINLCQLKGSFYLRIETIVLKYYYSVK